LALSKKLFVVPNSCYYVTYKEKTFDKNRCVREFKGLAEVWTPRVHSDNWGWRWMPASALCCGTTLQLHCYLHAPFCWRCPAASDI